MGVKQIVKRQLSLLVSSFSIADSLLKYTGSMESLIVGNAGVCLAHAEIANSFKYLTRLRLVITQPGLARDRDSLESDPSPRTYLLFGSALELGRPASQQREGRGTCGSEE
jgi:hypothetical protein